MTDANLEQVREEFRSIPMKLSWHDIKYTVKVKYSKKEKKEKGITDKFYHKEILKTQSGYVNSGETLFIMGSSGAGKTTLLNVLADRITENRSAKLEGEIVVNDTHKVDQKDFGKYGAYVMQDDVLFPTLTCEESITFAAQLSTGATGEELQRKVDLVIESLGLLKCRKTLIGSQQIKGLSGGERKRTSIGVELVKNPSILFLDEPTSGLDSFTANKIVKLLVNQSRLGKTVIATIHQPSSDTFALFDRLLLLMDGYPIYQGKAADACGYFEKIGFQIPQYANPADYFLKEFYVPYRKTDADLQKLDKVVNCYKERMEEDIAKQDKAITYEEVTEQRLSDNSKSAPLWREMCLLIQRTAKNLVRNPMSTRIRVIQTIVMIVLCILVFYDMGEDDEGVAGKGGFAFFISINQVMTSLFSVLLLFLIERPVFLREYAGKLYGVFSYFTSKSVIEVPFQVIFPFVTAVCVYFAVGFTADAGRFFLFALILILDVLVATSMGFFVGCAVQNASAATALVTVVMLPFILFAGYFVNLGDVYVWLRWLQYLSPIRYSTEAILRNEFEDNSIYNNSNNIYEQFNYDIGLANCIIILAAMAVGFRMLAALALKVTVAKVQ